MKISAEIMKTRAIYDAIKELGGVPSGHLYAQIQDQMPLHEFQRHISALKASGLVTEESNFLKATH